MQFNGIKRKYARRVSRIPQNSRIIRRVGIIVDRRAPVRLAFRVFHGKQRRVELFTFSIVLGEAFESVAAGHCRGENRGCLSASSASHRAPPRAAPEMSARVPEGFPAGESRNLFRTRARQP